MNHCSASDGGWCRGLTLACLGLLLCSTGWLSTPLLRGEEVGDRWGTEEREREYYPIVSIPLPTDTVIESGAFAVLPDNRVAVGTRRGEIYFVDGLDAPKPQPVFRRFADGLDEIFGLAWYDNALRVTQSCELTRVSDDDGDGVADRFDTLSDAWGYANYHEYAFGSPPDAQGNQFIALGLSESYNSYALFRGFVLQVGADGRTTAVASGLRSPGGIGPDEHGSLFYIESQGPWNCSCSLKSVSAGSFQGHPASFNWYPFAPEMGAVPTLPKSGTRIVTERRRVPQLTPYAVIFPYIRMGRSITGFRVNRTQGRFGPFENQLFLGDYTLSILMRATTEASSLRSSASRFAAAAFRSASRLFSAAVSRAASSSWRCHAEALACRPASITAFFVWSFRVASSSARICARVARASSIRCRAELACQAQDASARSFFAAASSRVTVSSR